MNYFPAAGKNGAVWSYTSRAVANEHNSIGSFDELAMPLFPKLYNFAHWLTQDRTEAEDLVQETYLKALKGFASFQQGTNFRAWMYRILRNTFLTSRTGLKAGMTVSLEDDEGSVAEPAEAETPESVLLAQVDRQAIENALENLPVKFREIVLLCDMEEMSYQEIATTLAVPVGTVMSRLSRARKAMRELLASRVRGASR
jgi:RNA polymerase sigma-70 factor, ECF subfamily